jgi:RND family efflux transporter MFP subunit
VRRIVPARAALLPAALVLIGSGCGPPQAPPGAAAAPAKVDRPVSEGDLAGIALAPEAETRLGIATARVERKAVGRAAFHGGEVQVPPGRAIAVSAPLAGVLALPAGEGTPSPGSRVRAGKMVFSLAPLWTPSERVQRAVALAGLEESRVDAGGAVEKARVEVDAARVALARAEQLLLDKAGSTRSVDETKARLGLAEATLKAAEARRDFLRKASLEAEGGGPLEIASPAAGILMALHAAAGQTVAQGAPLFEVAAVDELWVRVPIHAGDLPEVARDAEAVIGGLSGSPGGLRLAAKPVAAAPPSADPHAATVDLFYRVDDPAGALAPGQRVGITIPLKGEEESLAVPWPAVLIDIHGGAWVYERVEPRRFVRRRVEVRFVSGGLAVLGSGPAAGTEVVTEGAAELFGTELGFSK